MLQFVAVAYIAGKVQSTLPKQNYMHFVIPQIVVLVLL